MPLAMMVRTRFFMLALTVALFCLAPSARALQCSPIPDEPELNGGEHLRHMFHVLVDCDSILVPAASAAVSQFVTRPAGFGTGANGYFYQYGVSLLDSVNSDVVRSFLFPTLFRQREVYEPSVSEKHIWKRVRRVAAHGFLLSNSHMLNMSGVPASFALAGLSDAYYPSEQQRWPGTLRRAGINSAGFFVSDFVVEFHPEMCRVMHIVHVHC